MKSDNIFDKVDESTIFKFLNKLRERKKRVQEKRLRHQEDGEREEERLTVLEIKLLDDIIESLNEALT